MHLLLLVLNIIICHHPLLLIYLIIFIQNLTENLLVFAHIQVVLAGIRVQSPLRAMLSQLGCPPIKFGMFQPNVSNFFNQKGIPSDKKDAEQRFNIFFEELLWYTKKLKS